MGWLKKHYHWVVAAALFMITFIRGGVYNNLASLHLIPVTDALEISRTQYSLAGSAGYLAAMLMAMLSGALILRFGYRLLLVAFMVIGAVALTVMGKTDGYIPFFAGYAVWGLANGICGEAMISRIVSVWFHKHKGAVLGVVSSATGLGGSLLCILQTAAMEQGTYRSSYFLAAALFVAGGLLALLFIRSHPAKLGLLPYGDGERLSYKKRQREQEHWHGFAMDQMVRRPTFYMLLFGIFISCLCAVMAHSAMVPHLQDRGLSATQASSLQSILMFSLVGSKILAGFLCDAIGSKRTTLLCMGLLAVALFLLTRTSGFAFGVVAAIVLAFALPMTTITIPMLALSLFGYRDYAKYNGIFISMGAGSGVLGNTVVNAVYDRFGSYSPAFFTGAVVTVVMMVMYLFMYRLAAKDRKRLETTETQL